jgi:hypothetical protein
MVGLFLADSTPKHSSRGTSRGCSWTRWRPGVRADAEAARAPAAGLDQATAPLAGWEREEPCTN